MKKALKGSVTEGNLIKSFAGEAQARCRYTYFASIAKKNNLIQIQNIFLETADNENEHAKTYFKYLEEGNAIIKNATYLTGLSNSTLQNLESAIKGEFDEWANLYPSHASTAEDEGFKEIADSFRRISEIEKHHEERYKKLKENIVNGKVFQKDVMTNWICLKCGYIYFDYEAPKICPNCQHPQGYFELLCDNF